MNIFYFLPLISIPVFYFGVAFLKPHLRLSFNICAICTAVTLTWVFLLISWLAGMDVPTVSIGILTGMSIVGAMYKFEIFYKEKNISNFWLVRVVMIIGGFYAILALLDENWRNLIFILLIMFFGIFIPSMFFQGLTHSDVVKNTKSVKKSLLEKLDNCC